MIHPYVAGFFVMIFVLLVHVGYSLRKGKSASEVISFLELLILAALWPVTVPFMIGVYLGDRD